MIPPRPRRPRPPARRPASPAVARASALAVGALLAAVVVAADRGALPGLVQRLYAFPGGDKVGHFALVGAFALAAALAFPRRWPRAARLSLPAGAWAVAALVAAEELSQLRFAGRTASLADLAASCAGVVAAALLAPRLAGRPRRARAAGPAPDDPDPDAGP